MRIGSWRTLSPLSAIVISSLRSGQRRRLRGVEEGVEVAQGRLVRQIRQLAVDDERHRLLAQAAMRAQRLVERGEVVAVLRRAERLVLARDQHDVADAVFRQLEAGAG